MTNEQVIRHAVASVLTNAVVYPPGISHRVLGENMSNVIERTVEAVLATGLVEEADKLSVKPDVTRVELIVNATRDRIIYGARDVSTALQDEGRTLKVFLTTEG